jgi:thioredoxin reductase (NADPH)
MENQMREDIYDVIIIGGGPAGASAALYAARADLTTLVLDKGLTSGALGMASKIANYPGVPGTVSGAELVKRIRGQAENFSAHFVQDKVLTTNLRGEVKEVWGSKGVYYGRAVVIATGSMGRTHTVTGEERLLGRGVSYCATCDGAFFRDKPVAVVGGGNAAITEALELTKFASKITIIHRRDELRATKILQEKAFAEPKIEIMWDTVIDEIAGDTFVARLMVHNVKTEKPSDLDVSGVFMAVGFKPNTDYLKGVLELDSIGAIVTGNNMETSVPGVFAAGDIRSSSIRQVIAAAGDGAVAAVNAERYLSGLH